MRSFIAALVLYLLGGGPSSAHAQGDQPVLDARSAHQAGQQAYQAGRYLDAAKHFRAGHTIDPKPAFLLNIAQSYRAANRTKAALSYYQRYLAAAPEGAPLRLQVETMVEKLERELAADQPAQPTAATANLDQDQRSTPTVTRTPLYRKWWLWAIVSTAVVSAAGLGIYFGVRANDGPSEGALGAVRW